MWELHSTHEHFPLSDDFILVGMPSNWTCFPIFEQLKSGMNWISLQPE